MPTASTSLLGLALPVTGELSGTWGQTVNDSITSLLDSAVAGTTTLSADADITLTTTTLAANQARQAILLCTGARTAQRTITAPAQSKTYIVSNATTGGFAVKLVGAGPTTGVTIAAGETAQVVWTGSDFVKPAPAGGPASFSSLQVDGQYVSPYAMRNRIINGGMSVSQRQGAASTPVYNALPATKTYSVDRWYVAPTGSSGSVSVQQVTGSVANTYQMQITGGAGTLQVDYGQRVESANIADLAGTTVTLSVRLANTLLTTVTWIANYANSRDNFSAVTPIATGSFAVSASSTQFTASINLPAAAANGVEIVFRVGVQTSGTWTIQNVQLEAGSVSTPFEYRPYGLELALCQRYYTKGSVYQLTYTVGGSGFRLQTLFKQSMRSAPTTTLFPISNANSTLTRLFGAPDSEGFVAEAFCTTTGNADFLTNYTASAEL